MLKDEQLSPEDKLVQQLAAPMLAEQKLRKRFNSRNRDAYKRMSRPEKSQVMERGVSKIYALLGRFKVSNGFTGV